MLSLGLCLGIVAGNAAARAAGLDGVRVYVATLCLFAPALVGARLLYVATHWEVYREDRTRIWRRSRGGAMMYGGLLVALALAWPTLRLLELPVGTFADVATFTILVGMIVARVGCLLNGCCAGRATEGPFGMWLPDLYGRWKRRVPTQLLEMGWAAVLLVAAVLLWSRESRPGALFLHVVVAYALGRTVLETTREPEDRVSRLVGLAVSALLVIGALVTLSVDWRVHVTAMGGTAHG
jgi:phosphatidylglycerol:prolipoprotein diacylglycerol transferase